MSESRQPSPEAVALGRELARLQTYSGRPMRPIAAAVGVSQSTVSRWEAGTSLPSLQQVAAFADAVGAAASAASRLEALARTALDEKTFGTWASTGLTVIQDDVKALESAYGTLRHFQPALVPGLLQTPEYARLVMSLTRRARDEDDLDRAVAARVGRQSLLGDPAHVLEFLLTEAALRFLPEGGSDDMLRVQLDRIATLAEVPRIEIGAIRLGTPLRAIPAVGFVLHDDPLDGGQPMVQYDVPHKGDYVTEPADVQVYRDLLDALRQSAVFGDEAAAVIRALRA